MAKQSLIVRAISGAAALIAHVCITPICFAADAPAATFQGFVIVGGTTDYVYRGISLTDEEPTPLAYLEASYGMLHFSGMLVGTELGTDALGRDIGKLEADATVWLTHSLGFADFNVGAKYTGYPTGRDLIVGTLQKAERDFIEPFVGVTLNPSKELSLTSTLYWTPEFYYETGRVTTLEAQLAYQLPATGELQSKFTATVGHVQSENINIVSPGHGYVYWNAGVEARLAPLIFDLRYWDTDVDGFDVFDRRVVFSAGVVLN